MAPDEGGRMQPSWLQYPETMNAIVQLPKSYEQVLVYDVKGEIKGQVAPMEIVGKTLGFLTIYGDQKEKLTFYLGRGSDETMTSTTFEFSGNTILGTLRQPVILQVAESQLNVIPNPFDHKFMLQFGAKEVQDVLVQVYTVDGRKVEESLIAAKIGKNQIEFQPAIASGMYILRIQVDGRVLHKKIIRR